MQHRVLFAALLILLGICPLSAAAYESAAHAAEPARMVARVDVLFANDILDLIAEINNKPKQPSAGSDIPAAADPTPEPPAATAKIETSDPTPTEPSSAAVEQATPQPVSVSATDLPPADAAPSAAVAQETPAPAKPNDESIVASPVESATSNIPAPNDITSSTQDTAPPPAERTTSTSSETAAPSEKISTRYDPDLQ
ncbi:MAG: hypothetical protein AB1810_03630, partial [Pseudomonadota bacterium]